MSKAQVQGTVGGFAASEATTRRLKACALAGPIPLILLVTGKTSFRPGLLLLLLVGTQAWLTNRAVMLWRSAARTFTGALAERRVVAALKNMPVQILAGKHVAGHRGDVDLIVVVPSGDVMTCEVKAKGPGHLAMSSDLITVNGRPLAAKTISQACEARESVARVLRDTGLDVKVIGTVVVGAPLPRRVHVDDRGQSLEHHSGLGVCTPAGLHEVVRGLCDAEPDVALVKAVRKALIRRDIKLAIR